MDSTSSTRGGPNEEQLNGWQRARLVWRLLRDDRVSTWSKAVAPIVAGVYLVSPIDAIPDWFLGLGQIDDLGVIGLALLVMARLLPKLAPQDVVAEHVDEVAGRRKQPAAASRAGNDVIDTTYRVVGHPTSEDGPPARRRA